MLDKVANLKFMDHDIMKMQNFHELDKDQYLCTNTDPATGKTRMEAQKWVSGLEKDEIRKLFEIPHFRWSNKINVCVKVFLSCIHGGTLWIDPPVSIDTTLISRITRLRNASEDPTLLFLEMGERVLSKTIKDNYDTFRGKHILDVKHISDQEVRFTVGV
jgi:hypothetical protein